MCKEIILTAGYVRRITGKFNNVSRTYSFKIGEVTVEPKLNRVIADVFDPEYFLKKF